MQAHSRAQQMRENNLTNLQHSVNSSFSERSIRGHIAKEESDRDWQTNRLNRALMREDNHRKMSMVRFDVKEQMRRSNIVRAFEIKKQNHTRYE